MSKECFYHFSLTDCIEYVPISLNGVNDTPYSVDRNYLEVLLKSKVFDDNKIFVMDFTDCDDDNIEMDEEIVNYILNKKIVILCKNNYLEVIKKKSKKFSVKFLKDSNSNLLFQKTFMKEERSLIEKAFPDNINDLKRYINGQIICKFFYDDIQNNPEYSFDQGKYKYLESSNVYVNKYINIRSLFLHYKYTLLVINEMIELVKQFAPNKEEFSLLGVSNTGSILANLIGEKMGLNVESLGQIGPVYCLNRSSRKINRFKNKKYLIVSDVVCMGGEFRIAKGMLDMAGADLVGAVCVIKIRDIYREREHSNQKVLSVVDDLNQELLSGGNIDYKISCDNK